MSQFFHKRLGTTNEGIDYETLTVARIAMELVTDENVKEFYLSSNDEDFGDFDDVVVETELGHGTERCALQLKHNDRGMLSLNQLTQAKGNFSILKYFASWKSIKVANTKCVLFTNLKFNFENDPVFYLQGEEFAITVTKVCPQDAVSNFGYCYKFLVVGDSCSYEYCPEVLLYKSFFEHFYLYSNQENVPNLKSSVFQKFKTSFGGNRVECDQYVKFITEWSQLKGKKEKLNKEWIRLVIALKTLSPHIKPLSFNFNSNDDADSGKTVNRNRNILREAVSDFHITVFRKESYDEVKQLWVDVGKSELRDLETVKKLRTKYHLPCPQISEIGQVDELTLSISLWLLGKSPLIIAQDDSIHKILKLCVNQKFIILRGDHVDSCFATDAQTFCNLSDLKIKNPNRYNQLIENLTCSLQGKAEIPLQNVIIDDEKILTEITTDDLSNMVKNQFTILKEEEILAEPYVERSLLKSAIDIKILDHFSDDTVVIVDCLPQDGDLREKLKRHTLIQVNNYLSGDYHQALEPLDMKDSFAQESHTEFSTLKTTTIYFSQERCKYPEFHAVCDRVKDVETVHHFRFRADGHLEWIRTQGKVNDIQKYILSEFYSVRERDLNTNMENNVNVLISDPGMGKSELLKSFRIQRFPEYMTIVVEPRDVYSFLKNTRVCDNNNYADALHNFLVDVKYEMSSERDRAILRIFSEKNRVIYLWDALDELSDEYNRNIVTDIVLELSKNCVQWVASRGHLEDMLQQKFNVLSINLTKFNKEEQENYIRRRLTEVSPTETTEKIIEKITSSFVLVEHEEILGIPLQLFMLTELFIQNRDKYFDKLNKFFLLTDLYEYFIDEKCNIYFTVKLGNVVNADLAERFFKTQKDRIRKEHINAALRLLLPKSILGQLEVQTIYQSEPIGLVTEIKDERPRFVHTSFAEYLAACYFASNLEHKEILLKVMFCSQYTNVRFFFDLIMAQDSEAHVAILYKNFNFIKCCNPEDLKGTDSGGRSVLHLASSWGQRYPDLIVKFVRGTYVIEDAGKPRLTVPESDEYFDTIDRLVYECGNTKCDDIFNMTAEEYARNSGCLSAEMRIITKQDSGRLLLESNHFLNLLYYSAYHGYCHEFAFLIEYFEQNSRESENCETETKRLLNVAVNIKDPRGGTLVSLAAKMGHIQIVKYLVERGADINSPNQYGWTAFHFACLEGHEKIVEYLGKVGADFNLTTKDGWTPLCIASDRGYEEIVQFLVEAGADFNLAAKNAPTPLLIASQNGHEEIVQFLVEAGADFNLAKDNGATPLCIASEKGYEKIVEFLLKAGADFNLAEKGGATPLYLASQNGHAKVIQFLVKAGADFNLAAEDDTTPLFIASQIGHEKIVQFLIKAGADVNLATEDDATPLYVASQDGHEEIVQFLIKAGADFNLVTKDGATPLFIASQNGHQEIVQFLVEAGADFNLVTEDGATPLFIASQNGHQEIVQFLVEAGADFNLVTKDSETPLFIASQIGHEKIVQFLIKAGADVNLATKDDATPLYIASQNGHEKIAKFCFTNHNTHVSLIFKF